MAFDFRASQLRTSKIIVSGSTGTNARLLIYPIEAQSSPLNQGNINSAYFPTGSIGSDVFLFISGVVGGRTGTSKGIVSLGGDLQVSGGIYSEQSLTVESNINVGNTLDATSVQSDGFTGNSDSVNFFIGGPSGTLFLKSLFGSSPYHANLDVSGRLMFRDGTNFSGSLSSSLTASRTWRFPDQSGLVALTNLIQAGPNITVTSRSDGVVEITGSAGGGGLISTAYLNIAGYSYTTLGDPGLVTGQAYYVASELPPTSTTLRAVLQATSGNIAYVRLYNHSMGSYLELGGPGVDFLSSSATFPTMVESVDLLILPTFTDETIYELQLFSSNSMDLVTLGSAQFVCK